MTETSTEATLAHAQDCSKWWARYYHWLLATHMLLGIAGVVVGALVAAAAAFELGAMAIALLGLLSSVIVGIVSFIQPGRMANVFYDAYWRLKLVILQSAGSTTARDDLIEALEDGYTRIATIQPEALRKAQGTPKSRDVSSLSEARRAALDEQLTRLLAEQSAEDSKASSEADGASVGVQDTQPPAATVISR